MPTIVEAVGLTKRYPGASAPAVDAISFTVNEGEIFGLLGPNGAGKTTLISILSCLAAPDGGSAQVGGCDVVRDQNAVKRMIGLVPQELALYPSLSAHENLLCFGGLYGLRGADARACQPPSYSPPRVVSPVASNGAFTKETGPSRGAG